MGKVNTLALEYRFATESDVVSVVDLVESAYRGPSSTQGWTTEASLLDGQRTDPDEVRDLIANPGVRLLLAHSNAKLIGCVVARNEGGAAYIGMLAIKPECQALGLGRQLLERAEQCAVAEFGATRARMTVIIQREELIQWYERRGYERTDIREAWPYGNPRFGLPRRADLEFIVLTKTLENCAGINLDAAGGDGGD